jgi:hypothetical protein
MLQLRPEAMMVSTPFALNHVLIGGERLPEPGGRFLIVQQLGAGAFGLVALARDQLLERRVAVKVPTALLAEDQVAAVQEARRAALVCHPAVVTIYDVITVRSFPPWQDGTPALVMEYVEGGTLEDQMPTLNVTRAVRLLSLVAAGVGEIHRNGLLHRDLKPQNILLTKEGQPKIADFGMAKMRGRISSEPSTVKGTPGYIAPEALRTCPDRRADIWSLGVILYRMVTGQFPYPPSAWRETPDALPSPPSRVNPRLSEGLDAEGLDDVCAKCLDPNPRRRYSSAEALEVALGGLEIRTTYLDEALLQCAGDVLTPVERYLEEMMLLFGTPVECFAREAGLPHVAHRVVCGGARYYERVVFSGRGHGGLPLTFFAADEPWVRRATSLGALLAVSAAATHAPSASSDLSGLVTRIVGVSRGSHACGDQCDYRLRHFRRHLLYLVELRQILGQIVNGRRKAHELTVQTLSVV